MFWLIHMMLIFFAPYMLIISIPLHILVGSIVGNSTKGNKAMIKELKALRETVEAKAEENNSK